MRSDTWVAQLNSHCSDLAQCWGFHARPFGQSDSAVTTEGMNCGMLPVISIVP